MKGYDYSRPGAYFVTILVYEHECILGEIKNGLVQLTAVGEIARQYWLEIPEHYPSVSVDDFVVMPNHIHGIIAIHEIERMGQLNNTETTMEQSGAGDQKPAGVVRVPHVEPLQHLPPHIALQ